MPLSLIPLVVVGSMDACQVPNASDSAATAAAPIADPLPFEVRLLTVDANEGCAVGDVDRDGRLDVVAGRSWYRNGDWAPRPVRSIPDWNGYVESNGDFLLDVDGDGWLDVVAGGFVQAEVHWYRNPGAEGLARGTQWARHLLADTELTENEASFLHDIDGDGMPEWITNSWRANAPLVIWRFVRNPGSNSESEPESDASAAPSPALLPHVVGARSNGHGIGFGDLNNDGREDILVGTGWYERPDGDPFGGPWTFHADWNRPLSCPALVLDIDGDGRNDVLWGNPHDYGVYAWIATAADRPQVGDDGAFRYDEITIDRSFSQAHCLVLADLDGDGADEVITGKRVRAHNGGDPGGAEPPVVCCFSWDDASRTFVRRDIARNDVGIGLQVRTADLDDDGRTDIVVAGKDGTQILFNRSR